MILVMLAALALGGPIATGAEAWEHGQLDQALQLWERAEQDGANSGRLYYNLGNAWYRTGDAPRAIAAWRAAHVIRPRDAAITHNLSLVRSELEGVPVPVGAPVGWMDVLTVGELGLIALVNLLGASGWALLWRRRRGTPVGPLTLGVVAAVLAILVLQGVWAIEAHPIAVVLEGPAIVRDAASVEGGRRFVLQAGAEVSVVRRLDDWVLVQTQDGRRGWVTRWATALVGPRLEL